MPKRTTHTYSSEDALPDNGRGELRVYYCKHCGDHVLITDAQLQSLPRRKTDNAHVLERKTYITRLNVKEGPKQLIRRGEGKVERQFRMLCAGCDLVVCYRSVENQDAAPFFYLPEGSLTAVTAETNPRDAPVPPCIQPLENGLVQIAVDVDDKAQKSGIQRINADEVKVGISSQVRAAELNRELQEFMCKVLGLRLAQMNVQRGWSSKSKVLVVENISCREAYERLQAATQPP